MKRSTVIAFGVLLVLIGVVYWLEKDDGASGDVEMVFDVEQDAIDRVEIRRDDEEPIIIERVGDGSAFQLVAPVSAVCDTTEVDLVLSNLASLSEVRSFTPDAGAQPEEFGLDTPRLEVRFTTSAGSEHRIRFGKDTLTPSNQYAERDGSTDVLVVAAHVSNNLSKSAWDLRDKSVFAITDSAEPVRVSITRGSDTLVLENDAGVWWTHSPHRARVDRFAVVGMVARFRQAQMLALAADDAPTGLGHPEYRLDVDFDGDIEPLVLEIGSKKSIDYYARVPARSPVFSIEGGLVAELRADARTWWSKKLLHHPTTEETQVRISRRESTEGEQTLSRSEAQDLLSALSNVTAEEFATTASSQDPAFVITVTTDDADDEITIRLEDGTAYARRRNEDVALRLPAEAWTALAGLLSADAPS